MSEHPIRVAVAGVGNCAASLVQGVHFYRDADPSDTVPGLMHVRFGDYHVGDVQFVAAFDVDAAKVGLNLSEAILAGENNTTQIAQVPRLGVTVDRGPTLDGLGQYYRETITESHAEPVDVAQVLREREVDVLVSYLPVGSEEADRFYAQAAIDAGVAFVNALPVFIAGTDEWAQKFTAAGLPIVGDDIKSQVGATITHRVLAKLLEDRGAGNALISLEYKLEVWDSPNSAGVIIDAIRAAKIGLDRGIGGPLTSASSYFMKSPPEQFDDDTARENVEKFIRGEVER